MAEKRSGKVRRHGEGRRSLERDTLDGLVDLIEKIRSGEDKRVPKKRRDEEDRRHQDSES
ncbi:MAG: hypothetical protein ISR48_07570 [Alphaproteobacteria bacterium]|nr:hypothetical protein [Alphaproteobacteria bacterium]